MTALVDNLGYLYCATCAAKYDKSGESVTSEPHIAEECDACAEPVVRDPESWQAVAREGRRYA